MHKIERGKRAEIGVYDDACEIIIPSEDITFECKIPLPITKEIQEIIDKEGMTGLITSE